MSSATSPGSRVSDITVARSYEQWCPVAVGLDVLGDRWTLLIVRELTLGDQRFTDLRRSLPGLAPNLLTERLRSLVDMGLVTSVELPPPAARSVYRLTEEGRAAQPVLRALARFGARHLAGAPGPAMDAARAASALLLPWFRRRELDARRTEPLRCRLVVTSTARPEPTAIDLVLTAGGDGPALALEPVTGDGIAADVVVTTTVEALGAARRAGTPLADAPAGSARDVAAVRRALSI